MTTEAPVAISTGSSWLARAWARPLWTHVVLVAGLLVGLAFVADRPFTAYTTDEGAYALQARTLQTSGKWTHADPAAPLDPGGIARIRGDQGSNGRAFYAVHPVYPLLLAGIGRVAGRAGYVALSLLGTLLAGVAAALLGRRVDEGLSRPLIWVVALGSPLLFDGFTIEAHSIAAGMAALGTLAMVGYLLPPVTSSRGRDAGLLVAIAVLIGLSVLVRSEGLVLAAAFVAVLGALAILSKALRRRAGPAAVVVLAVAALTRIGEGIAIANILGPGGHAEAAPSASQHTGYISSRVEAARATLISPQAGGVSRLALFVVLGLAAALATGALVRVRASPRAVLTAGMLAAGAYMTWLVRGSGQEIQGLFVAWPFAGAVLLCLPARVHVPPALQVAGGIAVVATLGILATEYADGGSLQWGGRYLAIVIPLAAPVLAYAVLNLPRQYRRWFVACGAATTAIISMMAVISLRDTHRDTAAVFGSLRSCAALAGPSGSALVDSRPVVVTPDDFIPRFDWPDYARYQWLSPSRADLGSFLGQLAAEDVKRYVLVMDGPPPPSLGAYQLEGRCRVGAVTVVVLGQSV